MLCLRPEDSGGLANELEEFFLRFAEVLELGFAWEPCRGTRVAATISGIWKYDGDLVADAPCF